MFHLRLQLWKLDSDLYKQTTSEIQILTVKNKTAKAEPKKKHYTKEQREQLAKLAREELARQGILFSSVTGKEYDLRGDCQKLVASTDPRIILSGPRDCIIGESRIKNPITGEIKTIKELCENKIRPIVQTIYGPELAGIPFRKGYDDVFEIKCDDGSSFTATSRHQVLTDCGYIFVCEIQPHVTHLVGYEPFHHQSILERDQKVQISNAQSFLKKVPNYQANYSACFYPCDEQLPRELNNDQSLFPSRFDVLELGHDDWPEDGSAYKATHSPIYQPSSRRANLDSKNQLNVYDLGEEFHSSIKTLSLYGELCQQHHQFLEESRLRMPFQEQFVYSSCKHYLELSYKEQIKVRVKQVQEIIPKGKADYYDLEVPFAHHYFAEGAIHHNTGKTVAACLKAHSIASRYPRCQGVIARKTGVDLYGTVLQTFARIIRDSGVKVYGGEKPQWFDYPNGSRIWVGGLDNPGKTLSSERDFIYVNQCEELALDDWETISGSCSGRNAVIPHPQLFGDCNPGGSRHWIRIQSAAGKLVLLAAKHKDNPTIYNADGTLTAGGANRIATLEALTGVRRKRLYEGVWATSEGAVYEMFNATNTGEVSDHVQKRERKDMQKFYLALDDGFTNPAVILDIGCDSDGRWHIFREFYKSGWVQDDVAEFAKQWNTENRIELAAVDEAAAGLVEALKRKGLPAKPGKGKIFDGISKIQARLKVQKDGRPRLTIDPSCVETINEFESYIWKPDKDIPVDENNHSMGALRYLSDALNEPSGAFKSASDLMAPDVRSIVEAPHIQETEELTFDDNPFE